MTFKHVFKPIGTIFSPFATKETCPIQPVYSGDAKGKVVVQEAYAEALKDIEGFSHIYLLYLLDRAGEVKLVRPTFLDDMPHGIFASRHPCRPNSIGMSIVRLVERKGNELHVEGIDVLDGTPLLDIKPYVPRFDRVETASGGWTDGATWREKPIGRE
jgi:tRNA-Thr(GGU) m(6)t(6)A37 methyltransferase TsaA